MRFYVFVLRIFVPLCVFKWMVIALNFRIDSSNAWLGKVFDELHMAVAVCAHIAHTACFRNCLNNLYNLVFIINERRSTTGHVSSICLVHFIWLVHELMFTMWLSTHTYLFNRFSHIITEIGLAYMCWTFNSFRCYQTMNWKLKPIWPNWTVDWMLLWSTLTV